MSQLPKPRRHEVTAQAPAVQTAAALGRTQVRPHIPQLRASVPVAVSQPSEGSLSQLEKPALQVMAQTPPVHDGVPLVRPQATPQPPQLLASVLRLVSQPGEVLTQSPKPGVQVARAQLPARHSAVALGRLHARPQEPQWRGLTLVSTQAPPQVMSGAGAQTVWQEPWRQA